MRLIPPAILLLLAACTTTQEAPPTRAFDWGVPPQTVRTAESTEPVVATEQRLIYHVERAGIPLTLTYRFGGAGLRATHFFNRAGHADANRYIEDFERLKGILIEQHGLPRIDRMAWRNRMLADDPDRYGDAVAAGHLVYYTEWRTERGGIVMALRGERLQVAHELVFQPPDAD